MACTFGGHPLSGLAQRILPFLAQAGLVGQPPTPEEVVHVEQMVPLVQERVEELCQAPEALAFFFRDVSYPESWAVDPKALGWGSHAGRFAGRSGPAGPCKGERLAGDASRDDAARAGGELGLKPGSFFGVLRVAITGRTVAPPLFGTLAVLGRERSLGRLAAAKAALAGAGF